MRQGELPAKPCMGQFTYYVRNQKSVLMTHAGQRPKHLCKKFVGTARIVYGAGSMKWYDVHPSVCLSVYNT